MSLHKAAQALAFVEGRDYCLPDDFKYLAPFVLSHRVIINARTGSIVMNKEVKLDTVAVAHGNLSVVISSEPLVSQPEAFSQGQTVQTETADIEIKEKKGELVMVKAGASLGEVVKALNAVGASPQDLLAILQAMKAAGALKAELEII